MKKLTVLMLMFLFLLGSVCFAENSKSIELLDKYKDMRLSLEAGINRLDYQKQYREVYIATKKAQGLIPENEYTAFENTLDVYTDIGNAWDYQYQIYFPNEVKQIYKFKYPDIEQCAQRDGLGRYSKESIVRFLFSKACEKTTALESFIEKKDKESEAGFKGNTDDNNTDLGFSYGAVDKEGYIMVKTVNPGSAASNAGLLCGDKIGRVNDIIVSIYSIETYKSIFDTTKIIDLYIKRAEVITPMKITIVKP